MGRDWLYNGGGWYFKPCKFKVGQMVIQPYGTRRVAKIKAVGMQIMRAEKAGETERIIGLTPLYHVGSRIYTEGQLKAYRPK